MAHHINFSCEIKILVWVHMYAGLLSNLAAQGRVGFPAEPKQTSTELVAPSNKLCTANNGMVAENVRQ